MIKSIKNKIQKNFLKKASLYNFGAIQTFKDTKKYRTFEYFLTSKNVEFKTYVIFSPEKLIQDYIHYINLHYHEAEDELILLSAEPFYIYTSIFLINFPKKTLLKFRTQLKTIINQEREQLIFLAIQKIQQVIEDFNLDITEEQVH